MVLMRGVGMDFLFVEVCGGWDYKWNAGGRFLPRLGRKENSVLGKFCSPCQGGLVALAEHYASSEMIRIMTTTKLEVC